MSEEDAPRAPVPPPSRPDVRASDADRERLISELNEHVVAGRLTTDEFEERTASAYAAKTTGELSALRRDLPAGTGDTALSAAARRSHLTRRMLQESGGSAGLFLVGTIIWLASGAHGQFWPVWLLIFVALSFVRNAWALYGPAPDLDAVEAQLDARRRQRLEHGDRHDHHGTHDHRGRHADRDATRRDRRSGR